MGLIVVTTTKSLTDLLPWISVFLVFSKSCMTFFLITRKINSLGDISEGQILTLIIVGVKD